MIDLEILNSFAVDPNSFETNYKIGREYERTYQYSSAVGFLLRAADKADTDDQMYNSLVSVAHCLIQQNDNLAMAENILKRICYFKKERAEGWYFLCMLNKNTDGPIEEHNAYYKLMWHNINNQEDLYFIDFVDVARHSVNIEIN